MKIAEGAKTALKTPILKHDFMGQFITDAINEKLMREYNKKGKQLCLEFMQLTHQK